MCHRSDYRVFVALVAFVPMIAQSAAAAVSLAISGGTQLVKGADGVSDTLTIEASAVGGEFTFDRISAFGTTWSPARDAAGRWVSAAGPSATGVVSGGIRAEADGRCRFTATTGTLTLRGAFPVPAGEPHAVVVLQDSASGMKHTVYALARGYSTPNHAAQRTEAAASAMKALIALSNYLDSIQSAKGWLVKHPSWPDRQEDAHAIVAIANGYGQLNAITGSEVYRAKSLRALEWLLANQREDGAFGFPWDWSGKQGHFNVPEHFTNGTHHPAGSAYGISTELGGTALLKAYRRFGTETYLAAARRVKDYLLAHRDGLQWLDAARTRASIPYCTLTPILPANHPLVAQHDVVGAARNSSVDVYNIDASGIDFLQLYHEVTGDREVLRIGDALAANLAYRQEPDGAFAYGWHNPTYKPTHYAYTCNNALLQWGLLRNNPAWIEAGRRGMSWMTNVDRPSLLLWEYINTPLQLDSTNRTIAWVRSVSAAQRSDGSFTGGADTRTDAGRLSILSALLIQMGYKAPPAP